MAYVTKSHLESFAEKLLNNYKKTYDEIKDEIANSPSGGEEVKVDGTTITKASDGTLTSHAVVDTGKIKAQIETYMTENPVSPEVGDRTVTYEKLTEDVEEAIKSHKILFADTVADIKNLPLYDGAIVQTSGYYNFNDGTIILW